MYKFHVPAICIKVQLRKRLEPTEVSLKLSDSVDTLSLLSIDKYVLISLPYKCPGNPYSLTGHPGTMSLRHIVALRGGILVKRSVKLEAESEIILMLSSSPSSSSSSTETTFQCSFCKQILGNQTELTDHIDEFHSWFKCTKCCKSFSSKSKWEGKF